MSMTVQVEVTGINRTGTAKGSGNPYCMAEGYVKLPNIPYPQRFMFYCKAPNEIPQPGFYEVDVTAEIKNDRVEFQIDPRQGRRISSPAKAAVAAAS